MSNTTETLTERSPAEATSVIRKRALVRMIAARAGVPQDVAERVYAATLQTVLDETRAGRRVNFSGFGMFHGSVHRGHPTGFGAERMPDYTVLKFSATRRANEYLGSDDVTDVRPPGVRRKLAHPSVEGSPTAA